jgi:hypothetical protein
MITVNIGTDTDSIPASMVQPYLDRIRAAIREALPDVPVLIEPLIVFPGVIITATPEYVEHVAAVRGIVERLWES